MSRAVEIESLAVRFADRVAVADVSLQVEFGEVAIILGPNGAGKTTTVETLLGFRAPSGGSVRLMGRDPMRDHDEVVARTGALLQRGGVWFPMSPHAALSLTATYYSAPRDVDELLGLLGLTACRTTPWRRLSGGEQQRTLLALALLGRPRVLVLDEPSSAVDPEGHQIIRQIIDAERHRGCAILITTHELADAEVLADHVTILDAGRVLAAGTLDELAGEPVMVLETSVEIDLGSLASALRAVVTSPSPRHYRVQAPSSPERLAALTALLGQRGGQLTSLRSRASLEESYLALVGAERNAQR